MAKKIAKSNTTSPSFIAKYGKHEVEIKHIQIHGVKDANLSLKFNILDFYKKGDKIDFGFKLGNYTIKLLVEKHG